MTDISKASTPPRSECSAFCPECGADLYFLDGVCYCKNKACAYKCDNCKQEKQKLFYSDEQ